MWSSRKRRLLSKLLPLTLTGTLYLASDIHLGPSIMRTNQAFYRFLKEAEAKADALILPGDIFNVWFGDDVALRHPQPWLAEALEAFRACANQIPVYFIHGNRDFLIGQELCQSLGVQLLPAETLIRSDVGLLYICHGDEFCTDDERYMALRRKLRNPRIQALFLSLPRTVRQAIARYARYMSQRSQRKVAAAKQNQEAKIAQGSARSHAQDLVANKLDMTEADSRHLQTDLQTAAPVDDVNDNVNKAAHLQAGVSDIANLYYDVNEAAIEQALLAVQAKLGELPTLMIHGHTHKPALHQLPILGIPRIVLPDWDLDHAPQQPRAGFLKIEKKSVSLLPWENDTITPIYLSL